MQSGTPPLYNVRMPSALYILSSDAGTLSLGTCTTAPPGPLTAAMGVRSDCKWTGLEDGRVGGARV